MRGSSPARSLPVMPRASAASHCAPFSPNAASKRGSGTAASSPTVLMPSSDITCRCRAGRHRTLSCGKVQGCRASPQAKQRQLTSTFKLYGVQVLWLGGDLVVSPHLDAKLSSQPLDTSQRERAQQHRHRRRRQHRLLRRLVQAAAARVEWTGVGSQSCMKLRMKHRALMGVCRHAMSYPAAPLGPCKTHTFCNFLTMLPPARLPPSPAAELGHQLGVCNPSRACKPQLCKHRRSQLGDRRRRTRQQPLSSSTPRPGAATSRQLPRSRPAASREPALRQGAGGARGGTSVMY